MVFVPLKGDADDSVRSERAIYPTKWPASECKAELVFISGAQMAIQHTIHQTFVRVFECLGMLQSPCHTLLPRIDFECIRKSSSKRRQGLRLEASFEVPSAGPLAMVPYVLPVAIVEVREYLDRSGHSRFAVWSDRLNREAAVKVATALRHASSRATFLMPRASEPGFTSTGLILGRAIEFTSAKTETGL